MPGAPASTATAQRLWQLAQTHTPRYRAADYTQAIMDLGALVCRRSSPDCAACPVADSCQARAAGDAQRFPERAIRRPRRLERRRFFVVTAADGTCFVEQRPPRGIWGGLWSPPERPAEESARAFLALIGVPRATRARVRLAPPWRHGFTHYDLELLPVHIRLDPKPALAPEHGAWIDPCNHRIGLSAAAVKLLAATAATATAADTET